MLKLAAYGGTKVRKAPLFVEEHSKARFGKEEKKAVAEVIDSGHLCRVFGAKAKHFENEVSEYFSVSGAAVTASGTAAIHCALAAIGVGPGDEVITSPITDMGSVIPILALNAIPVFADVDPKTYNITAETIKAVLTNRTKAVIPVHFIGQSCVMEPILHLAKKHNIYIIEDCAQSYLSTCSGRLVGTMGDMGCFSLNDFKHITCGDGGFVISNNKDLISRARLFADKGYTRTEAVRNSVLFGLNYRISELQAAVASVQLKKLASIIERRRNFARKLDNLLKHVEGINTPFIEDGIEHSFWLYPFNIDENKLGVNAETFAWEVTAEGIPIPFPYIGLPIYLYDPLKNKQIYGKSSCPYECHLYGKNISNIKGLCPVAEKSLTNMLILPCSEFFSDSDALDIASALTKVCDYHLKGQTSR